MCRGPEEHFRLLLQHWIRVNSWFSRKQKSVALSLAEADYIAANMAACEGMWLRKLLAGLFECELDAKVVHCDN